MQDLAYYGMEGLKGWLLGLLRGILWDVEWGCDFLKHYGLDVIMACVVSVSCQSPERRCISVTSKYQADRQSR